jgi:hypothetical protein
MLQNSAVGGALDCSVHLPEGIGVNRFGRALYIVGLIGLLIFTATAAIPNDSIACDVSTDYPDTVDEAISSPTVIVTVERHSKHQQSDSSSKNDLRTRPTAQPRARINHIVANRILATALPVLCSLRR